MHQHLFFPLLHIPERVRRSPDKAPLALHIGFQIFRALPVCLPDCFLILRQKAVPAKANTSTELCHKNILFFTRWHETTIFQEWKAKKDPWTVLFPLLPFFNFSVYYHGNSHTITEAPDFCVKVYFTVKHNVPGSQKSADCPYQA